MVLTNLMLRLLQNNEKIKLIEHKGIWLDIGRPDDYMLATKIYNENKKISLLSNNEKYLFLVQVGLLENI